jgi:hypothetical protein
MNWKDELAKSRYRNFVPEYLWNNDNFKIWLKLMDSEFSSIFENIRTYPDIVNPDKTPKEFLESLGSYSNYTYNTLGSVEFNRELLTRMFSVWKQRGTEHSIIMAATHGNNKAYVGGDLFVPGYPISNDEASISIPFRNIFIHNQSSFSGEDVFADGDQHMPGVIVLTVPDLSEAIRDRVLSVMPAGVKVYYEVSSNFPPNTDLPDIDLGDFNILSFYKWLRVWPKTDIEKQGYNHNADIDVTYTIESEVLPYYLIDTLIHSRNDTGRMHSGFYETMLQTDMSLFTSVSMLSVSGLKSPFKVNGKILSDDKYLKSKTGEYLDTIEKDGVSQLYHDLDTVLNDDVEVEKYYNITFTPSTNTEINSSNSGTPELKKSGVHSSLANRSGMITGDITVYAPESPIFPDDALYSVDTIQDKTPEDLRDVFYADSPDVTQEVSYNGLSVVSNGKSLYNKELEGVTIYGRSWQNETPSSTHEVPINYMEGTLSAGSRNLCNNYNLLDNTDGWTLQGITSHSVVTESDGSKCFQCIGTGRMYYMLPLYKGQSIVMSAYIKGKGNLHIELNGYSYSWESGVDSEVVSDSTSYHRVYATAGPVKNDCNAFCFVYANDSNPLSVKDIQIEYGTSMTDFEPYYNVSGSVSGISNGLLGVMVQSGGNYTDSTGQQWLSDTLTVHKDGTGELVKRVWKDTFTGLTYTKTHDASTGYALYGSSYIPSLAYSSVYVPMSYNDVLSNYGSTTSYSSKIKGTHDVWSSISSGYGIYAEDNHIQILVPTTEDLTKYSSLTYQYILWTPIVTHLTSEQVKSFLSVFCLDNSSYSVYNSRGAGLDVILSGYSGLKDTISTSKVSGTLVSLDKKKYGDLSKIVIYGKSWQSGIPTQSVPVPIQSFSSANKIYAGSLNILDNSSFDSSDVSKWVDVTGGTMEYKNELAYGMPSCLYFTHSGSNYVYTEVSVKKGQPVTFSAYVAGSSKVHLAIKSASGKDLKTTDSISSSSGYTRLSVSMSKAGTDTTYLLAVCSDSTGDVYIDNVQVEIRDTVTEYFRKNQKSFSLPVDYLRSVPTYEENASYDTYSYSDGDTRYVSDELVLDVVHSEYYVLKRVGSVRLTGHENWMRNFTSEGTRDYTYETYIPGVYSSDSEDWNRVSPILCSLGVSRKDSDLAKSEIDEGVLIRCGENHNLRVKTNKSTVDEFKNYLKTVNAEVLYVLEKPVRTDLTDEQVENLLNFLYSGCHNLYTDIGNHISILFEEHV